MHWVVFVLLLLPVAAPEPRPDAPVLLAQRRAPYFEDDGGGRILAEVEVRLQRDASGTRLLGAIHAEGPLVDPVPGWTGIHGSNRITARELTALYESGALALTTPDGDPAGTLHAGRRGAIRERRLRADGSLDLAAASEEFLLELQFDTPPLPAGRHDFWLRANEVPRLRLAVEIAARDSRILAIEGIDGHAR
jgi:hypothetical protein